MNGIGKEWQPVTFYCLFILLIVVPCNKNPGGELSGSVSAEQFSKDTVFIHRVLGDVINRSFSSIDQALINLDSAVEIANTVGYEHIIPELVFYKGNLKYVQNNYQEAIGFYQVATKLAEERNDSLLIARCWERMASIQLESDEGLALKLYYQAMTVFEREQYNPGIAKVYNILGIYKSSLRQYDTAKILLNKAIELNQKAGNKYYLIENKGNLAYVLEQEGRFEDAEKILRELIDQLTQLNDSINLQFIYFNHSLLAEKMGNLNLSMNSLEKAICIAEPVMDSMLLPALYGKKGELYFGQGKMDSSLIFLNKSASWAHAIDDPENEIQALVRLAGIDSLKGNFHEAYLKNRSISILKDTVYERRIRNNIRTTELTYENEKIKTNLEIQKLKEKGTSRQRLLYLVLFIVSVIAIGLLALVLFLQTKNYHKNRLIIENELRIKDLEMNKVQQEKEIDRLKLEKIKEELKVKDRELVSIALNVDQKKEFLGLIRRKIKESAQNGSEKESVNEINKLLSTVGMQLNQSGDTDLFNKRFSMIHENFFKGIKQKHPELTKSDLRFCAYLKIHLSSSQIANILNVSQEAIRKTRYRLRKKMGLAVKESLEDYISRF